MKPVVLPMLNLPILHLLLRHAFSRQHTQALAWNISLPVAADSQHSLELVWKNFDKARPHRRPAIENPLRARAAGQFQMTRDQTSYDLRILRFYHGLKIDRVEIATLFCKVQMLIKDICDAAAHAGCEIPPARSQNQHQPLRHVLTAVIANALDDCGRSRVANRKSFPRHSIEKSLSAGRAV